MIDLANVITDIIPSFGAANLSDLDWCTSAELYQYCDEQMKRMAATTLLWVSYTPVVFAGLQSAANLPAGCVSVIHASWGIFALKETSVWELAALDGNYTQTTDSSPKRYSLDAGAPGTVTAYPIPQAAGNMNLIWVGALADIASGASSISIPSPLQDVFGFAMIGAARRKESDGAMHEIAEHCEQRVSMYTEILKQYYGEAS